AADRPGAGDQHRLAEEVATAVHRVQAHRERLRERKLAKRDVAADGVALALTHHEVFLEHALDVREEARAAEELHVRAELLAAFAATLATAARMRRAHRHLVADAHARDARTDAGDDRGGLMSGNQRLADDEVAVAALEVIVEIGAADATGAELQQHFAR